MNATIGTRRIAGLGLLVLGAVLVAGRLFQQGSHPYLPEPDSELGRVPAVMSPLSATMEDSVDLTVVLLSTSCNSCVQHGDRYRAFALQLARSGGHSVLLVVKGAPTSAILPPDFASSSASDLLIARDVDGVIQRSLRAQYVPSVVYLTVRHDSTARVNLSFRLSRIMAVNRLRALPIGGWLN